MHVVVVGGGLAGVTVCRQLRALDDGRELRFVGLVIASGAAARRLPGQPEGRGVHVLRTVEDALALREDLAKAQHMVVIGGGFIGLEVAASAVGRGVATTVVDPLRSRPFPHRGARAQPPGLRGPTPQGDRNGHQLGSCCQQFRYTNVVFMEEVMGPLDHENGEPSSSVVLIGNEFARVRLEVVPGPHGDNLRISSIRTGWTRTLSPASVERLSRLSIGPYLDALETPFGPEPDLAFSADLPLPAREESEHEPAETDLGRAGRDGSR